MTIYALSSGPGLSGVAVIRVSGENAYHVLKKLTQGKMPEPRVATLKKINKIDTNELIDEGVIIWFPGPNSYTGEDLVEFHIHGSKAVISTLLASIALIKKCRLAEPGEFTKRAFQNGKINLLKAESIADLISAETEIQRRQAIEIMEGKSSRKFNSWRQSLIKILSHIEAKIDLPEEALPKNIIEKIKKDSKKIIEEIEKTLNDKKVGERIREGFKIAIVGPTNAGKSSLLNYLSQREVAIVSATAGTTRDVIETHLDLKGYPVVISDTAGIRDSKNEIEKKGIKLALKRAEEADLRLVVVEPKSLDFTGFLKDFFDDNSILVVNKSDLLKKNIENQINKMDHVFISIKNNTNLNILISKIKDKLKNKFVSNENTLITRERHRNHLEHCLVNIKNFLNKNDVQDYDKAAEDLRLATNHLGIIVGKVDVEEILSSIFNDFCIGK